MADMKNMSFTLSNKVKMKELTSFTTQLSTLQDAGLPIVRSLKILQGQMKPGKLKNVINQVAEDVESGSTFSEALNKHPKVFDRLYVNMVKAGEMGGVLDTILRRLAEFMEKSTKVKKAYYRSHRLSYSSFKCCRSYIDSNYDFCCTSI